MLMLVLIIKNTYRGDFEVCDLGQPEDAHVVVNIDPLITVVIQEPSVPILFTLK